MKAEDVIFDLEPAVDIDSGTEPRFEDRTPTTIDTQKEASK